MSDNKYKLFRNYMVNELGISREDIKEWTMQAVKETVEKELRGFDATAIAKIAAENYISNSYTRQKAIEEAFKGVISDAIKEQLVISLKPKKEE